MPVEARTLVQRWPHVSIEHETREELDDKAMRQTAREMLKRKRQDTLERRRSAQTPNRAKAEKALVAKASTRSPRDEQPAEPELPYSAR